ncbi:5-amino-6-uracil reductase [Cercophora scortea]|uniref:2,5-diamino-6-ribosylamino-4(3H)-pyrimidinone 5'-phosphate reductase n=1 Tax=Cercophora scortea TaxID=314031 RepID=A0AAE0IDY9_9PEZI|nr:5-amino-6-uracil reductase [Cercophora scortea]
MQAQPRAPISPPPAAASAPTPAPPPAETLVFPPSDAAKLTSHLPPQHLQSQDQDQNAPTPQSRRPFVTLTFATSLDSSLSLAPGTRTVLSGPQSKAMTHHLRAHHAAILIGVGTAVADDPGLNCRIAGARSPRPVVVDPRARWALHRDSKVLQLARAGQGLAPFIVTAEREPSAGVAALLAEHGGKFLFVEAAAETGRFSWADVFDVLGREGLGSIMVEGGGEVINSLLAEPECELVDSVIVTIAPTWLGQGGVVVSPPRTVGESGRPSAPLRLTGVEWHPLGEDVVLCGKILR